MSHLLIRGAGPAGAVLALRARARGWRVTVMDPRIPAQGQLPPWNATYGALDPELPPWAREFFSPAVPLRIVTESSGHAPFAYRMLQHDSLRDAVEASGALLIPSLDHAGASDVSFVADCTGAPVDSDVVWQLAVGLVIPFSFFDDATSPPAPVFMDWSEARGPHPSFLYVQHVEDGVLFEETILATHEPPQAMLPELEGRLRRRLVARFPTLREAFDNEHLENSEILENRETLRHCKSLRRELVAIPMGSRQQPFHELSTVALGNNNVQVPLAYFGGAGGLIHPATGYSIGGSFAIADRFLDGLAADNGLLASKWKKKEKANAELARALRQVGAELITRADGETLRGFFGAFFALSAERQLAYLTGHDGIAVARTMWALRRQTGFRHPFLMPLWTTPRQVLRAVWNRNTGSVTS